MNQNILTLILASKTIRSYANIESRSGGCYESTPVGSDGCQDFCYEAEVTAPGITEAITRAIARGECSGAYGFFTWHLTLEGSLH